MRATRIVVAMLGLVFVTSVTVAWWTRREFLETGIPAELQKMHDHSVVLAERIDAYTQAAASDLRALAATLPTGWETDEDHAGLARRLSAELDAKPSILGISLLAADGTGRELVRVGRGVRDGGGAGDTAGSEPPSGIGVKLAARAQGLPRGSVHTSPLGFLAGQGPAEPGRRPIIRLAAPLQGGAVMVLSLDMRPVFSSLTSPLYPGSRVCVVDGAGSVLWPPLPPGGPGPVGEGGWGGMLAKFAADGRVGRAMLTESLSGDRFAAAVHSTGLDPGVRILETAPYADLIGAVRVPWRSVVSVSAVSLAGALLLAGFVCASLLGPLRRMTMSIQQMDSAGWNPSTMPRRGGFGVLTAAFENMNRTLEQHSADLLRQAGERERTEELLRDQVLRERSYLAVIESCGEAVVTVSLDGKITAWNEGAEITYGYTAEEAIGQPVELIVPFDRHDEATETLERAARGERVRALETERISRDGRRVAVSLTVSPLLTPEGEVFGIAKIARDITERREAEQRFRLVVEACPSGVCAVDSEGRILLVNAAVERLFGYTRDELIGQSVDILVPEAFRDRHAAHRDRFVANPEHRAMGAGRDLFALRKDGRQIAVEIGLSPIELRGMPCVLASIVDITERREAQRQLERSNAELEKFAYVVSHDIKAPLRGISAVAEWLAADFGPVVDDEARENLDLMLERTSRLAKLIDGILGYSRAGRIDRTRVRVDTSALLDSVIETVAAPENIRLQAEGPFPIVMYDETQLHQVFQNLIDNAVRHIGKPDGEIVVSCEDLGHAWGFRVRDNGVGIPERHFERIFDLFQTLHPKDDIKTTGAGLAIVKRIAESNGGKITVESEEGLGSTFTFTVPKTAAASAQRRQPAEALT